MTEFMGQPVSTLEKCSMFISNEIQAILRVRWWLGDKERNSIAFEEQGEEKSCGISKSLCKKLWKDWIWKASQKTSTEVQEDWS